MRSTPTNSGPDDRCEGGFILVAVIGVLLVLALVAQTYSVSIQSHVRQMNAEVERARALALSEAGVNLAIHSILDKQNARAPRRTELVTAGAWHCRLGEDRVAIVIADDAGRIDMNTADSALLEAFFGGLGIERERSAQLAAAILDFRDVDDVRLPGGAEAEDYRSLGLAGRPKNGPFDVAEELGSVRGIDDALLGRILPFVTVYSGHAGIDAGVATEELLSVLERGATGPTSSIQSGGRTVRLPRGVVSPSPRRTYRILATGWTSSGGGAALEVVMRLGVGRGTEYSIRRWRQVSVETDPAGPTAALPPC